MKNIKLLSAAAFALLAFNTHAQDNNDTNEFFQQLTVDVPQIAILDVERFGGDAEQPEVEFNMNLVTQEGGTYDFSSVTIPNMWLNYTSVISGATETNRQITVKLEDPSTFPPGVQLRISAATPIVEDLTVNGTVASRGQSTSVGGVLLDQATAAEPTIVNNIGSVYTGDGAFGAQLTYELEQKGNFSDYRAGNYVSRLVYTITDM